MFNRGAFNRMAFNRPVTSDAFVEIRALCSSSFAALIGVGKLVEIEAAVSSALAGGVSLIHGMPVVCRMDGALSSASALRAYVLTSSQGSGRLACAVLPVCKRVPMGADLDSTLTASVVALSKYTAVLVACGGVLFAVPLVVRKYLTVPVTMAGLLSCACDVNALEMDGAEIALTIPSGGVLTLDTNSYRLLVDGVNWLSAHDGDWARLSRDTVRMHIDSGGGAVAGDVTVIPLYL